MAYGITAAGFILKRQIDIKNDLVTALSNVTDPISGESLTVDLADENDPLVQAVDAVSDSLALAWEQLQLAYNQFDPLKATDAGLSGLVQLNGLTRKPGTYSTVTVNITANPLQVIPAGKRVSTLDNTAVFELPEITCDGAGSASVVGTAIEKGPIAALAGTVVKIVTPVAGWTAVTNPGDALPGTDEETDTELRLRQQDSTELPSNSIIEALYAAIIDLDDVTYARIYQNNTLATDSRSIPAKSIAPVIVGGDPAEIAEILFNKSPAGVAFYGTETEVVVDAQGIDYDIKFSRPSDVDIYVKVDVTVVDANLWPDDGEALIKAAIVAYALSGASGIGVANPVFDQNGYVPGESVYASELYVPINTVPGIKITSVLVGTAAPAAADSVAIAWNEHAAFDSANIDLTVS